MVHIKGTPPPRPILFDNSLLFAVFCCFFSMFKCVFFFWRPFYIFKKLCRVVNFFALIKPFSFNRMIFTKPRENQKTKTFQRMFGLRLMFFFGFPRVFLVFVWSWPWKKLKKLKVFFGFLDKLMVKELWKTKKNSGLFCFFAWIVVTCLLKICPKTKKDLNFFGFSQFFNHQFIQKTKKTLSFFCFLEVMTKKKQKNSRKTKKNKHEPQTKHSLNSFGFLFFWFYRGFLFFGFPHGLSPKEKSNSWLVPQNLDKPKNQKTKTFQRMFGLRLMFVFFGFPRVFLVFLVMTLKKQKKIHVF